MHTNVILLIMLLRLVGSPSIDLSATKDNYYSNESVNLEIQLTNKDMKWVSYVADGNRRLLWKVKITNLTSGNELVYGNPFAHYTYPQKSDYQILEPNETDTIGVSIDFNKLFIRPKERPGVIIPYADFFITEPDSVRYGKYSITVEYGDGFRERRHAIDRFQTNEIVVNYLKK